VGTSRTCSTPGAFRSTTKSVAPNFGSSLVRAITRRNDASPPPVENHLWPSITHPSPSRRAVVRRLDGSAPAPGAGSVMQNALVISARASGARYLSWMLLDAWPKRRSMFP
jgi:hypothetical protein